MRRTVRVAMLLMRALTAKVRDADPKRIEFGVHDTTGRVAARLVEMAEQFGQHTSDGVKIGLPFSQEELAGWTGASGGRERCARRAAVGW